MPSREYFDTLGRFVSYALSVNDRVHTDIYAEAPTAQERGFVLTRGSQSYRVLAREDARFASILSTYTFTDRLQNVYQNMTDDELDDLISTHAPLGDSTRDQHDTDAAYAAHLRVEAIEEDTATLAQRAINQSLLNTDVRTAWVGTETEHWDGVELETRVYPYEDTAFTVADYDSAVQSTLNAISTVVSTIGKHIDFSVNLEDSDPPTRSFQ